MDIIDIKSCQKAFNDRITFVKGSDTAVIHIDEVVSVHVDKSNLAFFATMGIKNFGFDPSNCLLAGEKADGTHVDLSAVIVASVAGTPAVAFFNRMFAAAGSKFKYYQRVVIKSPNTYNLTKESLACSHYHAFFNESYDKAQLSHEYISVVKSGNIAGLVGLMRRRVTNPGFVNGFVDFTSNEQASVIITAPIMGGEHDKKFVKITMPFATLLKGTEGCKDAIFFVYNGETNTLLCRNVNFKVPEPNTPVRKFVPWLTLAFPTVQCVNNKVTISNDLTLNMLEEDDLVAYDAIEGFSPISFRNPPARQTKSAPKEKAEALTAAPKKVTKAKPVTNKTALVNSAKAVIFNDAIPAESAIAILRNFNW